MSGNWELLGYASRSRPKRMTRWVLGSGSAKTAPPICFLTVEIPVYAHPRHASQTTSGTREYINIGFHTHSTGPSPLTADALGNETPER
jgi:hypothetical protein